MDRTRQCPGESEIGLERMSRIAVTTPLPDVQPVLMPTELPASAVEPSAVPSNVGLGAVTVHRDIAAVAAAWRAFGASATATPYQTYDWVMAYAETLGQAGQERLIVATVADSTGRPIMMLPLAISRHKTIRVASFPGGKQANFHMPLVDAAAGPLFDKATCRRVLGDIARAAGGIDVFAFPNQPLTWHGVANPFAALGGHASPSPGFKRDLDFPPDKTSNVLHSAESRKKIRKKERRLSELGTLAYRPVLEPQEIARVLDTFLDQKGARFQQKHINNPFADPAAVAFLEEGSRRNEGKEPAIELYALYLDERILATFGGTSAGPRFCGMFNSFSTDADVVKSSPGDLLLTYVIETQCRRGFATFDLGVGEAPYKLMVCDKVEPLIDAYVPVSMKGHLYAAGDGALRDAKRWAKRTPWAKNLFERLRRRVA